MARDHRLGLRIGQFLVGVELAAAALRQPRDAAAGVILVRDGLGQPLLLEPAQQPAHQPGIEAEIVAQRGDVGVAVADGVQDARGAERPAAAEKGGVERADLGGDGAVEAADAGDGVLRVLRHDL